MSESPAIALERRLQRSIRAAFAVGIALVVVGLMPGRRVQSDEWSDGPGAIVHEQREPAGGPKDLPLAVFVVLALAPLPGLRGSPARGRVHGSTIAVGVIAVLGALLGFLFEFTLDIFTHTTILWPQHVVVVGIAALIVLDVLVIRAARALPRDTPVVPEARVH